MEEENIIEVRDGYKKYPTSDYILKGVNMNVPTGSIYSLLGPSGCGKTTLLSCIVGLQSLSSGFIHMPTIQSPKDFGYMPQEIALQTVCTIEETFFLNGLMLGMTKDEIYRRFEELNLLLKLPNRNLLLDNLSGGEKRRISFAVALVHSPKTLLLDEPTVGLDPVLRRSIWDYLIDLAKNEGKAIIITTHYIEEARCSDKIGFMRSGKILREGQPENIMETYHCSNLEDAFIQLCQENMKHVAISEKPSSSNGPHSTYNAKSNLFQFCRFKSHLFKNYFWTKRNSLLLVSLLFYPLLQSLLFCITFGRFPNDVKLGFLSEESSYDSLCSQHVFSYSDKYDPLNCTLNQLLSCDFLQTLQSDFNVGWYNTLEDGISAVNGNKIWAFIYVNSNFTNAVLSRVVDGMHAADEVIDDSCIKVEMDMSSFSIGYHIQGKLKDTILHTVDYVARSCNINLNIGKIPIQIKETFFNINRDFDFGLYQSEAVGFIAGFIFYLTLLFTASATYFEKEIGVTDRNTVLGTTMLEIVTSHLVIQFILLAAQKSILLVVIYKIYDYNFNGSMFLTLIGLFLIESIGISLGMLLANLLNATLHLNAALVFFTLSYFIMAGSIWPEEGMHWLLSMFKWIFPGQSLVGSLRDVIIKDASITNPVVYQGFLISIGWILVLSLSFFIVLKIKKI